MIKKGNCKPISQIITDDNAEQFHSQALKLPPFATKITMQPLYSKKFTKISNTTVATKITQQLKVRYGHLSQVSKKTSPFCNPYKILEATSQKSNNTTQANFFFNKFWLGTQITIWLLEDNPTKQNIYKAARDQSRT